MYQIYFGEIISFYIGIGIHFRWLVSSLETPLKIGTYKLNKEISQIAGQLPFVSYFQGGQLGE